MFRSKQERAKREKFAADLMERVEQLDAALKAAAEANAAVMEANAILAARPYILAIEREGRKNKFTFARGSTIYVIETIGTWDDDVNKWNKDFFE